MAMFNESFLGGALISHRRVLLKVPPSHDCCLAPPSAGPSFCQVAGCGVSLENHKDYHQRYKVCEAHLKVDYIERDGQRVRFCQQCGRFQPLEEVRAATSLSCRVWLGSASGEPPPSHGHGKSWMGLCGCGRCWTAAQGLRGVCVAVAGGLGREGVWVGQVGVGVRMLSIRCISLYSSTVVSEWRCFMRSSTITSAPVEQGWSATTHAAASAPRTRATWRVRCIAAMALGPGHDVSRSRGWLWMRWRRCATLCLLRLHAQLTKPAGASSANTLVEI